MAGVGGRERVLLHHREKKRDIGWGRREKVVFLLHRERERERERESNSSAVCQENLSG